MLNSWTLNPKYFTLKPNPQPLTPNLVENKPSATAKQSFAAAAKEVTLSPKPKSN